MLVVATIAVAIILRRELKPPRTVGLTCRWLGLGLGLGLWFGEDLTPEEMSHIALIVQRQQNPINEQAFADCIRIVLREYQASQVKDEKDLQAFASRMRERKGMK